ncbi:MFS transporter [Allokutzneria albata]|uniref:Predicted arabinose efflux permease, MFS family n=1 Tax=Allokutzneria albata TaxID=211114 RepID=A0A1H0AI30_ALLAB|nr:MFS transporter [Allokutzneria albata]SDN32456.1 Predicted arabinose efflux permease, MFS family [Allokutzneria albata]
MALSRYRQVFALPGVRRLLLIALFARIPGSAVGVAMTLHVVLTLKQGYGAAGLVTACATIGMALSGPLFGRLVDRRGLRLMLAITTIGEATFWFIAPSLPYPALLGTALLGGFMTLPVGATSRQALAAIVPPEHRKAAFSLDTIFVETSYMLGPALGVLLATQVSTTVTMVAIGGGLVLSGSVLYLVNPPIRSQESTGPARPVPRKEWLTRELVGALVISAGAVLVLAGTDVAIVATLERHGQVSWTGVVIVVWCLVSLSGGFVYGAMTRTVSPLVLMTTMGLLTIPVGVATDWWWLCLAILPAGALCAPLLSATTEWISRLAPESVRGEVMGLQQSALTLGSALGAPFVGAVMDATSPAMGFVAAGALVTVSAAVVLVLQRPRRGDVPVSTSASSEESVRSAS